VVWEVLTGSLRREFLGHQACVNGLAVSPDGKRAASASQDLTALVWDLTGLIQAKRRPERVSAERLRDLWESLNGQDAQKAFQAAAALTTCPEQTLDLISGKELPAVPLPDGIDQGRLDRLTTDLDSDRFETREKAEKQLDRLGRHAEPVLSKALKTSSSLEQISRIKKLLEAIKIPVPAEEAVRASRAIEVLEWIVTSEARRLLEKLANGPPGGRLTEEANSAQRRILRESRSHP
jgi:hypothetical protein